MRQWMRIFPNSASQGSLPVKMKNNRLQGSAEMTPAKYTQLTFGFFLSIFMSCVVSGVSVLNTTGWVDGFLNMWMTAWFKSWIVAFPTVLVVAPLTRRLVGKLVADTTK